MPFPVTHRRSRRAATLAASVAVALTLVACGSDEVSPPQATGATTASTAAPQPTAVVGASPTETATATPKATAAPETENRLRSVASGAGKVKVGDLSLVAKAKPATIGVYAKAGGASAVTRLKNPLPSGAPLVFLVQERKGDWLRVLLPIRPNGSQGWVRASDVALTQHDFRITVSTGKHRITVYRAGKVVMSAPVGLGARSTPTPGGVFYIKELIKPPKPDGPYGPYAYGLSGYSDVLDEFLGGQGEIGIHGTDQPSSVGGAVSHGCIRMRNADITKLVTMLPLGVPVQIIA